LIRCGEKKDKKEGQKERNQQIPSGYQSADHLKTFLLLFLTAYFNKKGDAEI